MSRLKFVAVFREYGNAKRRREVCIEVDRGSVDSRPTAKNITTAGEIIAFGKQNKAKWFYSAPSILLPIGELTQEIVERVFENARKLDALCPPGFDPFMEDAK